MQIDFHHGVTYILARLAGFAKNQAEIIAHSAQYVDDATQEGIVNFTNRSMFRCTAAAHKSVDYRNFEALKNHLVWIPFHFLPGNELASHPEVPDFVQRLVCRPNSKIAQEMIARCIKEQDVKHGLHRLGITMHVYADTWAHQNFAGISHEVNIVKNIFNWYGEIDFAMSKRVHKFYNGTCIEALLNKFKSHFLTEIKPLGHGPVLSFPDRPFLKWKYQNHWGELIERDNPKIFLEAAIHIHEALVRFLNGDPYSKVPPLKDKDLSTIANLINTIDDDDGEIRHKAWLQSIRDGAFSFGAEDVKYHMTGEYSWRNQAFGKDKIDLNDETYSFSPEFMNCHWKLFHDAISHHRHVVLHELLPYFGICAA